MKLMTDLSALGPIPLAIAALSFLPSVKAAFAECVEGWDWSYNSKGLNPCEIAGSLQAPCLGFSVYELGPLSPGSNYVTPQKDDEAQKKCGCNTIIYSLYASCAICQTTPTGTPITWQFWSQYCDSVYVTQYPFDIPFNASVPHWTFTNWTTGAFDVTEAKAAGRDPEATPTAPPVVTISSTTSSPSTVSPSSTNSPTDTPSSGTGTSSIPSSTTSGSPSDGGGGGGGSTSGGSKTNVGAIAGGVVGGVIGLAGFAGVVFFFLRGRRARQDQNDILGPNPLAFNPAMGEPKYEQPKLYNPADPSTFPTPISGGDSSYSGGQTTNPFQPGRYNGAPEL